MAPDPRGFVGPIVVPRNTFLSKWDMLFNKDAKEWIAFKPALGLHVYPCYSCRHMFYSKKSFLDHVNRRAVVLQYKCPGCINKDLLFYNRCSCLLHCRKHFSLDKGQINLGDLEVSTLPVGLAGFSRHPDIPYLFDVEEELIVGNSFMNAQFYTPKSEDRGKEIISLTPSHLVINRTNQNGENQALSLKQIAKNIPKCQFISIQALKEMRLQIFAANGDTNHQIEIKSEPEDSLVEQITFSEEPATPQPSPNQQRREPSQTLSVNTSIQKSLSTQLILPERTGSLLSDDVEELVLPVITKIETVEEPLGQNTDIFTRREPIIIESSPPPQNPLSQTCLECHEEIPVPISNHFLGNNRPMSEDFRCSTCKLICPTPCSFKAHLRIHEKLPPYVCPDCGEEFSHIELLFTHMDEVCYHLTKSVRFRCPGKRCGKIFASDNTFGPHFKQLHIDTLYMCGICKEVYFQLGECENHCLTHTEDNGNIVKLFSCPTCGEVDMNWNQLRTHLDFHCQDLSRCIYIYMCKYCKCYFRSVQTMQTHLQNCKGHKTGTRKRIRSTKGTFVHSPYIAGQCKLCTNKIICLKSKPSNYCNRCLTTPVKSPVAVRKAPHPMPEKCVCILCKVQIDFDERRRHQQECRYSKPQVLVEKIDLGTMSTRHNESFSSSNSDLDGSHDGSPRKNGRDSTGEENRPKKRLRPSKPKKVEIENDLTAEKPILFDGTYQCCLCDYKNTHRDSFHDHIKAHRHISTAYQCMECGECFVVKPSLVKHLLHFHNISDSDRYFEANDCFDQGAVTELAKVVKAPYLANNVKENQCKVCMEQFDNAEAHDKHFRIHGMAFLMKNSI